MAQNHTHFPTEDHFGILVALMEESPDDVYVMAGSDSLAVWNYLYAIAARDFMHVNVVEYKAQCYDHLVCDPEVLQRAAQKLAQLL